MAELDTIANYAEIFGAVLVVGGLGFAVLELRRTREQRQEEQIQRRRDAAFSLFTSLGTQEFLSGIRLLYEIPPGLTKQELEERYPDRMEHLLWIVYQFENLGAMVHERAIPLDIAEKFFQVSIMNVWFKLQNLIEEYREITGKPKLYEFAQWLAEIVKSREEQAPLVYRDDRDWEP